MRQNGGTARQGYAQLFGEAAVRKGYVTPQQVEEALARQKELAANGHPHKLIGMILLESGALGTTELIEVLRDLQPPAVTVPETRRVAR